MTEREYNDMQKYWPEDPKKLVELLSVAYLYRRNRVFPTLKDINSELQRREEWLKSVVKKYSGEEGFKQEIKEMWMDPPEDFKPKII
jgi:hypothetical protein